MPGRVLNFLEFSDKYSNGSTEPSSVDDIKNAAANFEEGFDEETYDQPQIGPNRPVAGNYEATPAGPGEEGSPAFSADNTEDMNAPQENEEEPADSVEEPDEDDDSEEDDVEEGNPEAGANPKKKVEEGITLVKGFSQFINENYGDYPSQDDSDEDISAQAEEATEMLSDREKSILTQYLENDPEGFKEIVKDELEDIESGSNPRERDYEALGMDKTEFETRKAIHKILKYVTVGAGLAIVPAAMFISGGVAAALGVTALAGVMGKDAAFWKGGSHHYQAQDQAEYEDSLGSNPWDEDDDCCQECGEVPISNEYGYSCGCNM